jgi:PIN domain nuclease of toxin-antitoxin system
VNCLLDTCSFLWLALQPTRLSNTAAAVLNDAENVLFFSHASAWEITLKHSAGKLSLPDTPRLWLAPRLHFFQVQPLPIEMEGLILSGELPCEHSDPFDRLLAAQAISRGFSIITPDRWFSLLGALQVW